MVIPNTLSRVADKAMMEETKKDPGVVAEAAWGWGEVRSGAVGDGHQNETTRHAGP